MAYRSVLILIFSALAASTVAYANTIILIRYESEIHTGNKFITLHNSLNSGANITQFTVLLGTNMKFDTTGSNSDGLSKTLASSSSSNTITVGHFTPTWSANKSAADVGLVGLLSSSVVHGATSATFNFTDFNPGESWGFFVDMDTRNNVREQPVGSDVSGLMLTVYFAGVQTPLTSSCVDPFMTAGTDECLAPTFSGKKGSFPSSNSANVELTPPIATPEPASFLLIGSGLLAGGVLRKRIFAKRRSKSCRA